MVYDDYRGDLLIVDFLIQVEIIDWDNDPLDEQGTEHTYQVLLQLKLIQA
jgi:hypothetical protein